METEVYLVWDLAFDTIYAVYMSEDDAEADIREATGTGYEFQTEFVIEPKTLVWIRDKSWPTLREIEP